MKVVILIIAVMCFVSCVDAPQRKDFKKPFVITYKFPESSNCNGDYCRYEVTDSNGEIISFCESVEMYQIGDTIK